MPQIKVVPTLLIVCSLSIAARAQEPTIEYGSLFELRGVTRIFVDSGTNLRLRKTAREGIVKKLPKLEIVSRPEDAAIHLRFYYKEERSGPSDPDDPNSGIYLVPGLYVEKIINRDRVRLLMHLDRREPDEIGGTISRIPIPIPLPVPIPRSISGFDQGEYQMERYYVREFIKAYQKAN